MIRATVQLFAFFTTRNSAWETLGCRESVNNGEVEKHEADFSPGYQKKKKKLFWIFLTLNSDFPSSICTPEGVYCQDIDCRGRSWSVSMSEHSRTESAVVMWSTLVCVSSRWRLDALVSVVWLFCDLWRGHAGSDPCMYQPPTTEQWIGLQRTGQKNPGLPDASMFRFVHSGENVLLKLVRKIQNIKHFYWLLVT